MKAEGSEKADNLKTETLKWGKRNSHVATAVNGRALLSAAGTNIPLKSGIAEEPDHGSVKRMVEGFLIVFGRSRVTVVLRSTFDTVLPACAFTFATELS